jgi:hypothetical protein
VPCSPVSVVQRVQLRRLECHGFPGQWGRSLLFRGSG